MTRKRKSSATDDTKKEAEEPHEVVTLDDEDDDNDEIQVIHCNLKPKKKKKRTVKPKAVAKPVVKRATIDEEEDEVCTGSTGELPIQRSAVLTPASVVKECADPLENLKSVDEPSTVKVSTESRGKQSVQTETAKNGTAVKQPSTKAKGGHSTPTVQPPLAEQAARFLNIRAKVEVKNEVKEEALDSLIPPENGPVDAVSKTREKECETVDGTHVKSVVSREEDTVKETVVIKEGKKEKEITVKGGEKEPKIKKMSKIQVMANENFRQMFKATVSPRPTAEDANTSVYVGGRRERKKDTTKGKEKEKEEEKGKDMNKTECSLPISAVSARDKTPSTSSVTRDESRVPNKRDVKGGEGEGKEKKKMSGGDDATHNSGVKAASVGNVVRSKSKETEKEKTREPIRGAQVAQTAKTNVSIPKSSSSEKMVINKSISHNEEEACQRKSLKDMCATTREMKSTVTTDSVSRSHSVAPYPSPKKTVPPSTGLSAPYRSLTLPPKDRNIVGSVKSTVIPRVPSPLTVAPPPKKTVPSSTVRSTSSARPLAVPSKDGSVLASAKSVATPKQSTVPSPVSTVPPPSKITRPSTELPASSRPPTVSPPTPISHPSSIYNRPPPVFTPLPTLPLPTQPSTVPLVTPPCTVPLVAPPTIPPFTPPSTWPTPPSTVLPFNYAVPPPVITHTPTVSIPVSMPTPSTQHRSNVTVSSTVLPPSDGPSSTVPPSMPSPPSSSPSSELVVAPPIPPRFVGVSRRRSGLLLERIVNEDEGVSVKALPPSSNDSVIMKSVENSINSPRLFIHNIDKKHHDMNSLEEYFMRFPGFTRITVVSSPFERERKGLMQFKNTIDTKKVLESGSVHFVNGHSIYVTPREGGDQKAMILAITSTEQKRKEEDAKEKKRKEEQEKRDKERRRKHKEERRRERSRSRSRERRRRSRSRSRERRRERSRSRERERRRSRSRERRRDRSRSDEREKRKEGGTDRKTDDRSFLTRKEVAEASKQKSMDTATNSSKGVGNVVKKPLKDNEVIGVTNKNVNMLLDFLNKPDSSDGSERDVNAVSSGRKNPQQQREAPLTPTMPPPPEDDVPPPPPPPLMDFSVHPPFFNPHPPPHPQYYNYSPVNTHWNNPPNHYNNGFYGRHQ